MEEEREAPISLLDNIIEDKQYSRKYSQLDAIEIQLAKVLKVPALKSLWLKTLERIISLWTQGKCSNPLPITWG